MNRKSGWPLVAAIVVATACGDDGAGGEERGEVVIPAVEVVQARYDALPLRERFSGTVEASGQVAIYPEASGPITAVYAQDGDVVQAGAPLVRIEGQASRSQLAQAEASLTMARAQARSAEANLNEIESQFRRTQLLAQDSLVSQETLEAERAQVAAARAAAAQATAQVASARAAIAEQQEVVGRTIVRAPITGVVGRRNAEVGMIADGQTPLFVIGSIDRMRVEIAVPQDLIGRITPGQSAEITVPADPPVIVDAEVSRISPFLAAGSFSAAAEIDVPEPGGRLVPGMFVTVDVFYGESDSTTVVPTSALYDHPASGQRGVYIATPADSVLALTATGADGTGSLTTPVPTRFVPVAIVAEGRQTVGIAGVQPGEWVVVIGQHLLAREGSGDAPVARLRASTWERIIRLQERQGPELLREVMEEHRRMSMPGAGEAGTATPAAERRGS